MNFFISPASITNSATWLTGSTRFATATLLSLLAANRITKVQLGKLKEMADSHLEAEVAWENAPNKSARYYLSSMIVGGALTYLTSRTRLTALLAAADVGLAYHLYCSKQEWTNNKTNICEKMKIQLTKRQEELTAQVAILESCHHSSFGQAVSEMRHDWKAQLTDLDSLLSNTLEATGADKPFAQQRKAFIDAMNRYRVFQDLPPLRPDLIRNLNSSAHLWEELEQLRAPIDELLQLLPQHPFLRDIFDTVAADQRHLKSLEQQLCLAVDNHQGVTDADLAACKAATTRYTLQREQQNFPTVAYLHQMIEEQQEAYNRLITQRNQAISLLAAAQATSNAITSAQLQDAVEQCSNTLTALPTALESLTRDQLNDHALTCSQAQLHLQDMLVEVQRQQALTASQPPSDKQVQPELQDMPTALDKASEEVNETSLPIQTKPDMSPEDIQTIKQIFNTLQSKLGEIVAYAESDCDIINQKGPRLIAAVQKRSQSIHEILAADPNKLTTSVITDYTQQIHLIIKECFEAIQHDDSEAKIIKNKFNQLKAGVTQITNLTKPGLQLAATVQKWSPLIANILKADPDKLTSAVLTEYVGQLGLALQAFGQAMLADQAALQRKEEASTPSSRESIEDSSVQASSTSPQLIELSPLQQRFSSLRKEASQIVETTEGNTSYGLTRLLDEVRDDDPTNISSMMLENYIDDFERALKDFRQPQQPAFEAVVDSDSDQAEILRLEAELADWDSDSLFSSSDFSFSGSESENEDFLDSTSAPNSPPPNKQQEKTRIALGKLDTNIKATNLTTVKHPMNALGQQDKENRSVNFSSLKEGACS